MHILLILQNVSGAQKLQEEEGFLGESGWNVTAEAMELKEAYGGTVTAALFSQDVPDAEKTLRKVYSYGVDGAYHVFLREFDFSDTKAFAAVIAETINRYFKAYDLVLFGRLAYDGDAVTIAAMTAEYLKWPRIVYSRKMRIEQEKLVCEKYIAPGREAAVEACLPALVQSIRKKGLRRQPKIADILRAYSEAEICRIDGGEILAGILEGRNRIVCVREIEPYDVQEKEMKLLNGANDRETAEKLIETLRELGFCADSPQQRDDER